MELRTVAIGGSAAGSTLPGSHAPTEFEQVYREYGAMVHRYCLARLGDANAAEDAAAQTFEAAFRAYERVRPRRETVYFWLLKIARNAVIDEIRRQSRLRRLTDRLWHTQAPNPDPETTVVIRSELLALLQASRRLSKRDRELVALRCAADLSYREIGELVGLSENSATVATRRAFARLRVAMEG
ncbi:MAG: RNA polymerase sigma factor [Candidatus Dormibacteria bacterium]